MAEVKKKKGKFVLLGILALFVVLAVAAVCVWQINEFTIEVNLAGDAQITLQYGQSYVEPGASAKFYGTLLQTKPLSPQVIISGQVDETKLGAYTITYSAEFEGYSTSAQRVVRIVDLQAPQIVLVSDPLHYTIPGQPYEEEGYSALDNYDGDLTANVIREEKDGVVYYSVKDSSGNEYKVQRTIIYNDPVAPVIALKGESKLTLALGQPYKEAGYTAKDNCDGDITAKVVVQGSVDIAKPGTYTITYSVKDSYSNAASATRTVIITGETVADDYVPQIPDKPLPPNGKVICLTFDDGPGPHTARLLDVLKKYNVKATFFVINSSYLSLTKRMVEEGHTVALHSASHKYKDIYKSEDAYFADLYKLQDAVFAQTGYKPTILRFPGGTSNTISKFNKGIMTRLTKLVLEKGFRYFDWNVDSNDAGGAHTSDKVFANVVKGIGNKKYSVVLQHDIHGYSVDAVERIIQWGLASGYTFEALTMDSTDCHHPINN